MPAPTELTRHHALPRRYLGRDLLSGREGRGYTGMDLFKFFGLISALSFGLAYTYIRYLELFTEVNQPNVSEAFKLSMVLFAGIPLLLALIAVLGFLWWAGGALVEYSRWQRGNPVLWRWFWLIVLLFFGTMVFDPLDTIHREMSRKGMAPAPNLMLLFDGKLDWFQFQWGYALLWTLLWFLILALHAQYFADGLREVWFYTRRIHRYTSSVLTGFSGTLAVARSAPVTLDYPRPQAQIFAGRGAPRLNTARLSEEQVRSILAADASRSIALAPGQRTALLVDLGSFSPSAALIALSDENGNPLLIFDAPWPQPGAERDALIVPLARPAASDDEATS